jgi:hypothetical protein
VELVELAVHLEPEVLQDQQAFKGLAGLELPGLVGLVGLPEQQE